MDDLGGVLSLYKVDVFCGVSLYSGQIHNRSGTSSKEKQHWLFWSQ